MEIIKIMTATTVGTTLMTSFSYLVSKIFNKLYKEPVLLNYVLQVIKIDVNAQSKKIYSWIIHYFIGLFFVIIYDILWHYKIQISIMSALIFGAISGIIGIVGWASLFKLLDTKPKIDYQGYYLQLFFAHIIFALGVLIIYLI